MSTVYNATYNLHVVFTEYSKEHYGYEDISWSEKPFSFPFGNPGWNGLYTPEGIIPGEYETMAAYNAAQGSEAFDIASAMLASNVAAWQSLKTEGNSVVVSATGSIYQIYRVDDGADPVLVYP